MIVLQISVMSVFRTQFSYYLSSYGQRETKRKGFYKYVKELGGIILLPAIPLQALSICFL